MTAKINLDLQAQDAIQSLADVDRDTAPDQLKIPEIISGCEIISVDPQGVGLATIPRLVTVTINEYNQLVKWSGTPNISVGDLVTVVRPRGANLYHISGVSGSTGAATPADVYQYVWVYDMSEGQYVYFDTLPGALAYTELASGDSVLIPPGVYDISITLVDGVIIVEQIPGTVILHSTSASTCVTCADGGYINVKEIRCTRGAGNNPTAVDASGLGANETTTIYAEWIKAECTEATGAEEVRGIKGGGSGILHVYADYIDADITENGGGDSCYAVDCDGDTFYIFSDSRVDNDSDGSGAANANLNATSGMVYWRGHLFITSDSTGESTYNIVMIPFSTATVWLWGDCTATVTVVGGQGGNVAHMNGTFWWFGNGRAIATEAARSYNYGGVAGYLYGRYYAETTGNTGAEDATAVNVQAGTVDLHGDGIAAGINGNRYGIKCSGTAVLTAFNGQASGATYDIIRTAGTMRVSMVDFDTYSGTITQYYPMVDDAWIGIAGGAGARLVFDTTPAPDRISVRDADLDFLDGFKILLGTGQDGQLYSSGDNLYIENATQDHDVFIRINDGGTVGNIVAIDASASKLTIQPPVDSTTAFQVNESDGTNVLTINTTNNRMATNEIRALSASGLKLYDDGGNGIFVDDGGNVGIGTTNPEVTLDMLSTLRVRGTSTTPSSPATGTGFEVRFDTDADAPTGGAAGGNGASIFQSYDRDGSAWEDLWIRGDDIVFSSNGSNSVIIDNAGNVGTGTTSPDRLTHAEVSDATTNSVVYAQRLSHITSNTAVTGFGIGTEFELEENDGTNRVAGILECLWTDAGEGVNADADFVLKLMQNDAAAAEVVRAASNGDWKIQNDYYAQGNQGLSGTLTVDDGANWRFTLTFVGGILTGQTTAASSGATCTWV